MMWKSSSLFKLYLIASDFSFSSINMFEHLSFSLKGCNSVTAKSTNFRSHLTCGVVSFDMLLAVSSSQGSVI